MGIKGVRFPWSLPCPVLAELSAVSHVTEAACHVLCRVPPEPAVSRVSGAVRPGPI